MDIQSLLLVSLMMISNTDHNEGALDWQHLHHHLVWDIILLGHDNRSSNIRFLGVGSHPLKKTEF